MHNSVVETLIGAAVLVVAGFFLFFATNRADVAPQEGYQIVARFERVDGLGVGSDVRLSGIKVGTVSAQELDFGTYQAKVTIALKDGIRIPEDSSAAVVGDGLLGSKYVAIEPGGADEMLADGDEITLTQSAVNIEHLLGKFMFSGDDKAEDGAGGDPATDGGF